MIEATQLSKHYEATRALHEVSFSIDRAEIVGLLGPNGAGKTTLMKILTGYLHPSAGHARIADIDVVKRPLEVQRMIGYLPENAPLYLDMLVQEYLWMIAELREVPDGARLGLIGEAVERTGLGPYLLRPIGQLSKGYRQRVGLAQAILHKPKVLILDEPTTGLDPSQIVEIRKLIAELAKEATVLLSTHILSEVELSCQRVLIINEGQVRVDAQLEDLRSVDAAFVAVEDGVQAATALRALAGVDSVESVASEGHELPAGFVCFRVAGSRPTLCPEIYDLAREKGWRLAELRREQKDLESVFRGIVEQGRDAA